PKKYGLKSTLLSEYVLIWYLNIGSKLKTNFLEILWSNPTPKFALKLTGFKFVALPITVSNPEEVTEISFSLRIKVLIPPSILTPKREFTRLYFSSNGISK